MSNLVQKITAPNGVAYEQPLGLFINNKWTTSSNGQKIVSINPTTESEIVSVYAATEDDVDSAVRAARAAFESETWYGMDGTSRGQLMVKLADIVQRHEQVLATIEALDNGKPYSKALGDIEEVYNVLRYYAGWADKHYGQTIETSRAKFTYTIREPIGVCGQIVPWNYPIGMASWKLGPALACGNTIVIKASEQTPLSILYFANLVAEAGFPPGVLNIINGHGSEAGATLVQHPAVDKVAFTGSTATGKEIMKLASRTLKNITLETGGKSPLVIFDDAPLESAVKAAHFGVMGNMGQICTATSRVFVHEKIYDSFMDAFVAYVAKINIIGDPFDDNTSQGAQVSKQQFDKILAYVQAAKDEGATIVSGGAVADDRPNSKGYFIAPTVVGDVKPNMRVYREEIFGPFGVFVKFSDENEVIQMANDTDYGLAAAICTRDNARIHRVVPRLKVGMVSVNATNNSDFRVPFGGVKQSGIGRELGQAGLDAYSSMKAVLMNIT
ncbi:Aldehyde dehydrogenase N-terminal [Penicillium argentinense]|uniref:aldehyde dehydrogenase (NAD(+)) n=1 Tax=Penicillium argentinense TaxID=1131581 RepID=A0A9W9KLW3_9EURO|nr:Aldehyde dehydrogenase N-terminal [Penicillium argentinense]KAJ5110293.1 Aldehyde dehydrogenase N-terminal [Penicillium argentinense]